MAPIPGFVAAGTNQAYRVYRDRFTFLINSEDTGGRSCTMEVLISPNGGSKVHTHNDADEQFYILDGTVTMRVGEMTFRATTGDVVFIPRQTPHSINTGTTAARVLATFTPGGIEDVFRSAGEPIHD
jgi:quercetin dioxygenase-like cupin family protein